MYKWIQARQIGNSDHEIPFACVCHDILVATETVTTAELNGTEENTYSLICTYEMKYKSPK